jgi:hypothetical protein
VRDIGLGEGDLCVGLVNGWGHITTTGVTLRAELAYPRALWLPFDERRRRAERKAARVVRRLEDYGVPVRTIRIGDWAHAFDRAFVDSQASDDLVAMSNVHGVDRFVVEPIDDPVPTGSRARRQHQTSTTDDHDRGSVRPRETSRWRRPAAE